jgi:hypothetical protein
MAENFAESGDFHVTFGVIIPTYVTKLFALRLVDVIKFETTVQ